MWADHRFKASSPRGLQKWVGRPPPANLTCNFPNGPFLWGVELGSRLSLRELSPLVTVRVERRAGGWNGTERIRKGGVIRRERRTGDEDLVGEPARGTWKGGRVGGQDGEYTGGGGESGYGGRDGP